MVSAVGGVPVNPLVAEAELGHHFVEVPDVVGTIGADGGVNWVVRPSFGIFEVKDFVAELPEAGDVLEVIPRDATERVLPDQACNDDPHRPVYNAVGGQTQGLARACRLPFTGACCKPRA